MNISITAVFNADMSQARLLEIFGQPVGADAAANFYCVAECIFQLLFRRLFFMLDHSFEFLESHVV